MASVLVRIILYFNIKAFLYFVASKVVFFFSLSLSIRKKRRLRIKLIKCRVAIIVRFYTYVMYAATEIGSNIVDIVSMFQTVQKNILFA